jgi:hypothetical protein
MGSESEKKKKKKIKIQEKKVFNPKLLIKTG